MLGFAWHTLRQAQEALKNGRLEEAHRLLCDPNARGHKGSWELMQKVASGFVERGDRHLKQDDVAGAWNDLLQAEQVGVEDKGAAALRQALTRRELTEVKSLMEAGEPGRAGELIVLLQNRNVRSPELQKLNELAKGWVAARDLGGRGQFAQAVVEVERVRRLWGETLAPLEQYHSELLARRDSFSSLLVQLHRAAKSEDWSEVVRLSEQVLALAPNHEEAKRARSKAWKAVEPLTVSAAPKKSEAPAPPPAPPPQPRFLLWIDGVGGYLVCLGNKLTLGQATPDTAVDIPLFADVSRAHASLTRDSEGYLLEAMRGLQVNGRGTERALLRNGDRIMLGQQCQLMFRQPVSVSTSARLDLVSGHRLPLAVDGVLLMAETLVLGPGTQVHVAMPDLEEQIVLFRQKEGLGIRHAGGFVLNGQRCTDRGSLGLNATVSGDDFGLALEPLGSKMGRA